MVRSKVRALSEQADSLGFHIYPATQRLLTQYVNQAIKAKTILPSEAEQVCAALLGAAIKLQADKATRPLDTRMLRRGWYQQLSPGPGNCPPHVCASTIIGRWNTLQQDYPAIGSLLKTPKLK